MDRVAKRYGDVQAVEDVSFTVGRGEISGLLGPKSAALSEILVLLAFAAVTAAVSTRVFRWERS